MLPKKNKFHLAFEIVVKYVVAGHPNEWCTDQPTFKSLKTLAIIQFTAGLWYRSK